jgi:hypothetical protein
LTEDVDAFRIPRQLTDNPNEESRHWLAMLLKDLLSLPSRTQNITRRDYRLLFAFMALIDIDISRTEAALGKTCIVVLGNPWLA